MNKKYQSPKARYGSVAAWKKACPFTFTILSPDGYPLHGRFESAKERDDELARMRPHLDPACQINLITPKMFA